MSFILCCSFLAGLVLTCMPNFQDERRPACRRCEKLGTSCGGFRDATFVHGIEQVMKRLRSVSKLSLGPTEPAKLNAHTSMQPGSTSISVNGERENPDILQFTSNAPFDLSTSPLQHESHVLYTTEHLAKGPLAMIYRDLYSCNATTGQSLISCCLLALAKIYFGFHNKDSEVSRDGMRLYSQGLGMLSDALDHDKCQVTTEIIASVLSLSVAEVGDVPVPQGLARKIG